MVHHVLPRFQEALTFYHSRHISVRDLRLSRSPLPSATCREDGAVALFAAAAVLWPGISVAFFDFLPDLCGRSFWGRRREAPKNRPGAHRNRCGVRMATVRALLSWF